MKALKSISAAWSKGLQDQAIPKWYYFISGLLVCASFALWFRPDLPPISSNTGFILFPWNQVANSATQFNSNVWTGPYVPAALGAPVAMAVSGFFYLSGGSSGVAEIGPVILIDALSAPCLFYLVAIWLRSRGTDIRFAFFTILVYTFNSYKLLSGFGTTDGYFSNGVFSAGDPGILVILTFLTFLTLFRSKRYVLLLGGFSFFAFSSFPTGTLILAEEYAVVLLLLNLWRAFYPNSSVRADQRLKSLAINLGLIVGVLTLANSYLIYPLLIVGRSYGSALGSSTPSYTFSFGFDSTERFPNSFRLITNWAIWTVKSPPWAVNYLHSPGAILFSFVPPLLAFGSGFFLKRRSDLMLYTAALLALLLSTSTNSLLGSQFEWATTNVSAFRAFYNGETFDSVLLILYSVLTPVAVEGVVNGGVRWLEQLFPKDSAESLRKIGRRRRLERKTGWSLYWRVGVTIALACSILIGVAPMLMPTYSHTYATGYPTSSQLPAEYPDAASFLRSKSPDTPVMVFPEVQSFDSNAVNGSTWYYGIDLYPGLFSNPVISSAYPSNYHGESGESLPPAAFVYNLGTSLCSTSACLGGGRDPLPGVETFSRDRSVNFVTTNSSVIDWQVGFETDNVTFQSTARGQLMQFLVNSSVNESNGHWLLGYLPHAESFSGYTYAIVNLSSPVIPFSDLQFGFHSFTEYGSGNGYFLGDYTVIARWGSFRTIMIPLASPSLRGGGTVSNVTNLYVVDDSTQNAGKVPVDIHDMYFATNSSLIAPIWQVGSPRDTVSLNSSTNSPTLTFEVNTSVPEVNGHWLIGYFAGNQNLSKFDFAVVNYTLTGGSPEYLQFGFHSHGNFTNGDGYEFDDYITIAHGHNFTTLLPLDSPNLVDGGTLADVSNLYLVYSPPAGSVGEVSMVVSSLRLTDSDIGSGSALASDLNRLGVGYALVDTSIVPGSSAEPTAQSYNEVFLSSPDFHEVFHSGTVSIYQNLLYRGEFQSPDMLSLMPAETGAVGDYTFSDVGAYYNASGSDTSYVPRGSETLPTDYSAASVEWTRQYSATRFEVGVSARTESVLDFTGMFAGTWTARLMNGTTNLPHFPLNGFSNGWILPPGNYTVEISIPSDGAYAWLETLSFSVPFLLLIIFIVCWYRSPKSMRPFFRG